MILTKYGDWTSWILSIHPIRKDSVRFILPASPRWRPKLKVLMGPPEWSGACGPLCVCQLDFHGRLANLQMDVNLSLRLLILDPSFFPINFSGISIPCRRAAMKHENPILSTQAWSNRIIASRQPTLRTKCTFCASTRQRRILWSTMWFSMVLCSHMF